MSDVIVIGVAGGTGSGKTTLVKALMNRFGDNMRPQPRQLLQAARRDEL